MHDKKSQSPSFKWKWLLLFGPAYLFDRYVAKKGGYTDRESYGLLFLLAIFLIAVIAAFAGWL